METKLKLFAAILVLAVGCAPTPVRGIVAKKNHRPAWTELRPMMTGRSGIVLPIRHPEQWDIVVQSDGTDGGEGRFLVVVTQSYWEACDIGDVWQRADTVYED